MLPSDQQIIGILIRGQNGMWQLTNAVNIQKDENVLLLPTPKGQVPIIGHSDEGDYLELRTILKERFQY